LPFDPPTATTCFRDRLAHLRSIEYANGYELKPSLDSIEKPCAAITENLRASLYEDTGARQDVARLFHESRPGEAFSYAGWDKLMRDWIELALDQGIDAQAYLDPTGQAPIISNAIEMSRAVRKQVEAYPNLKALNVVGGLGVSWALKAMTVTVSQLDLILRGLDNVSDIAPEAVRRAIPKVESSPNAMSDELYYANSLTAADKDLIRRTQSLVTALGLEGIHASRMASLLDVHPPREVFAAWLATAQAAKEFSDRDAARVTGGIHSLHQSRKQHLLKLALEEGWMPDMFAGTESIAPLARLLPACASYSDVSQLVDCNAADSYSSRPSRFFDPGFNGRYARLAGELRQRLDRVRTQDGATQSVIVDSITREFFGPLWNRCESSMFSARQQQLLLKLDARLAEGDSFRRFQIDNEIRNLISAGCQ
jgi:hypothetical protein